MTRDHELSSLQRAIDRALPVVERRLALYPEQLAYIHQLLVAARERSHADHVPVELGGLGRLFVDSYSDLQDHELASAIEAVIQAADAQATAPRPRAC